MKDNSGASNGANPQNGVSNLDTSDGFNSMKFNVTAGVLESTKMPSFERILWRISKGNIFLKSEELDQEELVDPVSGDKLQLSMFMLFFQGEELKIRVKKVCEGI